MQCNAIYLNASYRWIGLEEESKKKYCSVNRDNNTMNKQVQYSTVPYRTAAAEIEAAAAAAAVRV
jgi:hypothetical protein